MARIRTIKPEFFTSADIVALTPLARLLYQALWCEADREGRMKWAPATFKLRYLPADDCDINVLCAEIIARGLVVLYGQGLAYIPTFATHQHVNPRESKSALPEPLGDDATPRVTDASARVSDATVTHREERKGKEGEGKEGVRERARATPLMSDAWQPEADDLAWLAKARPDITDAMRADETEKFRNHHIARANVSAAWGRDWRNWMKRTKAADERHHGNGKGPPEAMLDPADQWRARLRTYTPGGFWSGHWGPRPEQPGCFAPAEILAEWKGRVAA